MLSLKKVDTRCVRLTSSFHTWLILIHSCGTLEVSLASGACGSVIVVGSVPLCKLNSGHHPNKDISTMTETV